MDVIHRSNIKVTPHKYGYRSRFNVKLSNGHTLAFENYAATHDKAMTAAIKHSERLIERGYPNGAQGGLSVETYGTYKGGGRLGV